MSYRLDVKQNAGATYWCIEELSFWDASNSRLTTQPSGASAQSSYAKGFAAGFAFNEVTNNDASFYCSRAGVTTGWLQYDFASAQQVNTYKIERLHDKINHKYSPVSWTLSGRNASGAWHLLDTQSGHSLSTWTNIEVKSFVLLESHGTCFGPGLPLVLRPKDISGGLKSAISHHTPIYPMIP